MPEEVAAIVEGQEEGQEAIWTETTAEGDMAVLGTTAVSRGRDQGQGQGQGGPLHQVWVVAAMARRGPSPALPAARCTASRGGSLRKRSRQVR